MTEKERLRRVISSMYEKASSQEQFLEMVVPMRKKISKGIIYSGISESAFNKIISDVMTENGPKISINESILDPVNKKRCPEIFDNDNKMHDKVKKQILKLVDDFREAIGIDFKLRHAYLIGSSSGFQYTMLSDIDIELETDLTLEDVKGKFRLIPKGVMLEGTQKPINLFLIFKDEEYDFKNAENVYDVVTDEWKKMQSDTSMKLPYNYILDLSRFFMNGCDIAISQYERDLQTLNNSISLDPETQEISVSEKIKAIEKGLESVKNDVDSLVLAHHIIFEFEKEGYEGSPFRISIEMPQTEDPHYSVNNLVYKMIDKFGYFDKMNKYVNSGKDKIKEVQNLLKELASNASEE